jgi:hypothetical protein
MVGRQGEGDMWKEACRVADHPAQDRNDLDFADMRGKLMHKSRVLRKNEESSILNISPRATEVE